MLQRASAFVRSPVGRVLVASCGLAAVVGIVVSAGVDRVWSSVERGAWSVPVVFVLDGLYNALELLALRELYGVDRKKLPTSEVLRAGLVAYALGGVMPLGRPVVESVRAVALARWTSGARAAAAGTRLSYMLLITQSLLCAPCIAALIARDAPAILPLAVLANAVVTGVMGAALYLASHRSGMAARLPWLTARAATFAPDFDRHIREEGARVSAWALVAVGRAVQVLEYVVLLRAFAGAFDVVRSLCIVGVQMVGSTLADVVPTHLGGTEAIAPLAASAIAIPVSDALAIPLIVHAQQAVWIAIGFVALAWVRPRAKDDVAGS